MIYKCAKRAAEKVFQSTSSTTLRRMASADGTIVSVVSFDWPGLDAVQITDRLAAIISAEIDVDKVAEKMWDEHKYKHDGGDYNNSWVTVEFESQEELAAALRKAMGDVK